METRIHVIDDNPVIRECLASALEELVPEETRPIRPETWSTAKEVCEELESPSPRAPRKGEIAICDLFDVNHYAELGGRENFKFEKGRSLPGSPENIKRASLDNISRFFPPLVANGLRIVVFSYVFALLQSKGDGAGAAQVRKALREVGVAETEILEKPEKEVSLDHLIPIANHVAGMIAGR